MDKKKYFIMLGSIIAVILVLLVSMAILSSCTGRKSFSNTEKELKKAAENYINDGKATILEGQQLLVTSDQLVNDGYMKSLEKLTKDSSCSGSVLVMNNGGQYNYLPNLTCTDYKTVTLNDKIIDQNLTTKKDGLYANGGEYIFKGKNPNNHLQFAGQDWYIIKIDQSGNIKLISASPSNQIIAWDNKFNEETGYASGENVYSSSDLFEYINSVYKGYKEETKKHLVPFSVCTGTRARTNLVIGQNVDCATTISDQYVGLLNPTDYANASYDKDCTDILKGSCSNFNYLYETLEETWTSNAIADSTYEAILYMSGRFSATVTRELHKYYNVITISGSELYTSGDGSLEDPYIVK